MNMLASLTTSADIAGEKDTLGGGSGPLESGIYKLKCTLAYLQKSAGGALGLFMTFKTEDGRDLRQTVYVTSGTAKGGTHTYKDKDGQTQYLPGFLIANSLAQLTTGKELFQLEPEQKVVNIYNYDAKAEVPTQVPVITDLLGQEIWAGVIKQTVDKNVETAPGSKVYVPSGETRDENEIDKFFCAKDGFDKLTSAEIRAKRAGQEITELFYTKWEAKNKGQTRNKAKGAQGNAGAPKAAGTAAAGGAKPSGGLFA